MPLNLPPPLQAMARGSVIGGFEGFGPDGSLRGWACPLADQPAGAPPLSVLLQVEDLLNPGHLWSLGEAEACWRPRQWCKSPGPQPGVAGLSVRTSGDRLHG
ncbi:hypothetical protein I1E95_14610 [Synechococcus sp. CBW1107]|uniref:hypothetical protein n=1 Tax=Synechococcus sp. CBW1107 TaxID=2789857 RepID=UPI0018CE1F4D|nr:hypothetical protein [Synechococcus sp. CBW1107]QPN56305.1 hypothetical protein I1E95_14610 [Synechococcus sp. CBW1107]